MVSGVFPPAAPFALPVAVSIVFPAWVYKALEVTRVSNFALLHARYTNILLGMMGYIVYLTIVMQSLFLLALPNASAQRSPWICVTRDKGTVLSCVAGVYTRSRAFAAKDPWRDPVRCDASEGSFQARGGDSGGREVDPSSSVQAIRGFYCGG